MTVTLTGKIVAIMAIVAILILGSAFRRYVKITNSILKEQDRQIKQLKKGANLDSEIIKLWDQVCSELEAENKKYKEAEEARKLDEKMLLPKQDNNPTTRDLEF